MTEIYLGYSLRKEKEEEVSTQITPLLILILSIEFFIKIHFIS